MSNDDFKEVYSDASPIEKLNQLIQCIRNECRADYKAGESIGRNNDGEYWNKEYHAMRERASWLYDELTKILTNE